MTGPRRGVRPQSYLLVYAVLAMFLVLAHAPVLNTPYYWDEIGQFIPASLDLFQTGAWIPHSTVPNVHPPGVMAWLATVWRIVGYSIPATRVAMLVIAALGALATFLLAIELGRGAPGAPAFAAVAFLCVSPLFYAQAMLAQLDMPAMSFTALALLLFLQNRFAFCASVCVVLVLVKETGLIAPALCGCWLIFEKRARAALWFLLPFAALALWLTALKHATGHWLGNAAFTEYNLWYPLNPIRAPFALLRRLYYLFIGSGHFIGFAALFWAWHTMPLFRDRSWRIAAAFAALHTLAITLSGGAVLERYLLPVLPVLYAAFAIALRALRPRVRLIAFVSLLVCLLAANFINPVYPFPFENNLAFLHFIDLERKAAREVESRPGVVATAFPMSDALRRPEFGYVSVPRHAIVVPDFRRSSLAALEARRPDMLVIFNTTWDPLHILDIQPIRSLLENYYGYEPQLPPERIGALLSMRVARTWRSGGIEMSLLTAASSPRETAELCAVPPCLRSN
jgi:hypothetical protein